ELEKEEAKRILAAVREHPSLLQQLHQKLAQDRVLRDLYESQVAGAQTLITALDSSKKP
ncbi:MAG: hypothetical protein ACI9LU_001807, partial [Polaribacter sp.]